MCHKLIGDGVAQAMMCERAKDWFLCDSTLKNCNRLHTLEGYGHTLSIIRNKHHMDFKGLLMIGYSGLSIRN